VPKEQIFVSYSHKDNKWRDELDTHLKPYVRDRIVSSWSDQQILPGSQWFDEISQLASSKIAGDFIDEHELGPLLKANQGGVKILWIPVRSSAYKQTPLKTYQAIIDPSKPLTGMPKAKRVGSSPSQCYHLPRRENPLPISMFLP
jgi:internalin A